MSHSMEKSMLSGLSINRNIIIVVSNGLIYDLELINFCRELSLKVRKFQLFSIKTPRLCSGGDFRSNTHRLERQIPSDEQTKKAVRQDVPRTLKFLCHHEIKIPTA